MRFKLVAVCFTVALTGCSGLNDTEQRTLTGAGIGAAGGTVIGAIAGNAGLGLAIGAVTGAAGGYVYDQHKKSEERAYQSGYQDAKRKK